MKVKLHLDIDNVTEKEMLQYLSFLEKHKRLKKGMYRTSSSGTGFHAVVIYSAPDCFGEAVDMKSFAFGMRYALGDCFGRIKIDMARVLHGMETDRLFYMKNGKRAGEWMAFK